MTIVQESGTPVFARQPLPAIRRRRATLGLTAVVAIAAVTALGTSSPAAWTVFAAALALAGTYAVLLHRSRRLQMERDLHALLTAPMGSTEDHTGFYSDLGDLAVRAEIVTPEEHRVPLDDAPAWQQALGLVRFVAACIAGWALAPVVFALTIAVGRTPRDTAGQRWLANLEATQLRFREQSRRTLVVSAAATASVTGMATATAAAGTAAAATRPLAAVSAGLTPSAAATTAATAGAVSSSYTVVAGDTLTSIAARFGTTYQALAATNHIANANLIYPGQVLVLGETGAVPAPVPGLSRSLARGRFSGSYTVVAGDTLSSIAGRFGTTYQALAQINGIANPNLIPVGEVLRLSGPAAQGVASPTPPAAPALAPTTTHPAAPTAGAPTAGAPTSAPTAGAPAASSRAQIAVRTALAQVGQPYVWGGAAPGGFDCSGLAMYAWAAAGVQLAHYTVSQYQETVRISQGQLQPGDLVFYNTGSGAQPGHVTIYIGGGRVVTADSPGTVVRVENLDWDGIPMGFGRVG